MYITYHQRFLIKKGHRIHSICHFIKIRPYIICESGVIITFYIFDFFKDKTNLISILII